MKEAVRNESNTAWTTRSPCVMGYTIIPCDWKEYIFHKGSSCDAQSVLVSGLIPGGKENDKSRQTVFITPLDPFGNNPDEEKPHDDYTIH